MSDPEGNSYFCFPESPDVSRDEVTFGYLLKLNLTYSKACAESKILVLAMRVFFLEISQHQCNTNFHGGVQ